ncbi:sensor histidine kinase [Haloarcula marina]|uniref:sensor histidine kinase n=1 Tax=Haloarcula marina TaxID=2961574 RepID=UPI0020B7D39C|nr:histidine kinase N-terminal 7TM domain-containing protein [Halomicroarcula marina]
MKWLFIGYVMLFSVTAVVCLATIPRARSIQHPGTRKGLIGLLGSVSLWSAGYVGYFLAPTEPVKYAFYIIGFVFAFVAVGAWLYFCAAYTGRPPREAPYRNVAIGIFLVFTVLKFTNPLHNLYFTAEWTTDPFPHLAIQHQLLYWIVLGLSYAVIAVGFFMLIEQFYHTGTDSRPLIGLLGLTAIPTIVTILGEQIEEVLPLMYEPPGVALFAVGTLFVYIHRFEAIRLTGETDDPAVFLGTNRQILDYNQAASRIFPDLQDSIGTSVESVSSSLAEKISEKGILTVMSNDGIRAYEVSSAPFMAGEVQTGQLVTLTDVTARESYREQLEEKTEQLEALNRMVRHDIRNDMQVILAWGEQLQNHVTVEGKDALDRVLRKSRHVIEITDIVGDFVESLSDERMAELEPIALDEILESELATVRDSHPDVTFRVSGNLPQVSVYANELLSSVFRNLFENAVQHNDEEIPEITVTYTETKETVRVQIADNGPGIHDSRKEQIFGKGQKGLNSPSTGIGLYLVYTLTRKFDGDVWVEDNEPKGAVFIVELLKS